MNRFDKSHSRYALSLSSLSLNLFPPSLSHPPPSLFSLSPSLSLMTLFNDIQTQSIYFFNLLNLSLEKKIRKKGIKIVNMCGCPICCQSHLDNTMVDTENSESPKWENQSVSLERLDYYYYFFLGNNYQELNRKA